MKKITAAALAATMTLPLTAVDASAATNEMRGNEGYRLCVLTLDGQKDSIQVSPKQVDERLKDIVPNDDNALLRTAADMTPGKKAVINGSTVLAAILAIAGLASPFVGPMIQQFLPR